VTKRRTLLQREIKQRRPFRSRGEEAVLALLKTADLLRRFHAGLLAPSGVTPQQYNVLRILRGAEPDALPVLEIADRMIEKTPGITRLLDRLERKGLVTRQRCPGDRRQVLCHITPGGLALLSGLDADVEKADRDFWKELKTKDLTDLVRLLEAARRNRR
jgi:DNA-binding MarR family transcriptional regulator